MNGNQWARLLAYLTGLVNQEPAPPERVPGGGEPSSPGAPAGMPAPVGTGAMHALRRSASDSGAKLAYAEIHEFFVHSACKPLNQSCL
jgi:hypothetical protein